MDVDKLTGEFQVDKIIEKLRAPLDRTKVKPPPAGKYGEYVEAYHVITEANRIFGEFGWHYSITALERTNEALGQDRNGKDQWQVGWLARVRVNVLDKEGATREDVGHGQGHSKSLGDAHDSAVKEAVTDALKRSLRTFGNTFGLALYDKTQANVEDPAQRRQAAAWIADMEVAADMDALKGIFGALWKQAPDSMKPEAKAMYERRKAELSEAA